MTSNKEHLNLFNFKVSLKISFFTPEFKIVCRIVGITELCPFLQFRQTFRQIFRNWNYPYKFHNKSEMFYLTDNDSRKQILK